MTRHRNPPAPLGQSIMKRLTPGNERAVLALLAGLAGWGLTVTGEGPSLGARLAAETEGTTAVEAQPKRHFRVQRPANLSDADALSIYVRVQEEMQDGYRLSRDPHAEAFGGWQRYNSFPYRSATHGERFVNNYANPVGREYGRYELAGPMARGTVVAKDSFAVTTDGDVFAGPLFLMEKMAEGFDPKSRDWRYSMIMPDGSLFGVTNGLRSEKVEFCITCHQAAGDENDHLFFIPEDYRQRALKL